MHVLCTPTTLAARLHYVVLELFLLVDVETERREDREADVSFVLRSVTHYAYKRDGADALLASLARTGVPVGIWTHETRRIARATLRRAFPSLRPAFVYTRRSCAVHNDVYVKDTRRLRRRSLLVDFNATQIVYQLEHGINTPALIDPNANLAKVLHFLRRRLSPQYKPVVVV